MSAPDARIALRARGLLESADVALRFLVVHARPFAGLWLRLVFPGFLASLAMRYLLHLDWVTTWCASIAVAGLLEGPFTLLAGRLAVDGSVTQAEVLREFSRRAFPFMMVLLLATVCRLGSLVLFVVPWFFVAPLLVFVPEVVLLEKTAARALRRSARLASGQSGRAAGLALLLTLGRIAMVLVAEEALKRSVGYVFDAHTRWESLWSDGGSPYALVGLWLGVPVLAVIRYVAYIDFRTLREGWDVQRRFQVLGARLAAEANTP